MRGAPTRIKFKQPKQNTATLEENNNMIKTNNNPPEKTLDNQEQGQDQDQQ